MPTNNFKVYIFDEETQSFYQEKFISAVNNTIETNEGIYNLEQTKKFYDETNGKICYFINLDLPARMEVTNLKKLRRSTALNNIFNYSSKKSFDLIGFMPWIILILFILFN